MTMPEQQRASAEDFAVTNLRNEPGLDFGTLRDRARAAGLSLQPIHYGRARKQLGLPPLTPPRAVAPAPVATAPKPADRPRASWSPEDADDAGEGASMAASGVTARRQPSPADENGSEDRKDEATRTPAPAAEADLVQPRRKGSASFDFVLQEMRRNPDISYADVRDRGELQGFSIAPIVYGRAKAVLGLVPVRPRSGKRKAAAAPAAPRQLKQVESVAAGAFAKKMDEVRSLDQLVNVVKELDGERRRLRAVLDRIVAMIDEALG
jgi:hypothetical protein